MAILCAGMLLWMGVHLMPALLPNNKKALLAKLGQSRYKLMFTVLILTSVLLIVVGWRSATPEYLYHFGFARHLTFLLMLVALLFFVAAKVPSRVNRLVRHPQLTFIFVWAGAHLLANGDTRSLVLFGGMSVWSVLEMFLINKRDGKAEKKPPIVGFKGDVIVVVGTVVLVGILIATHQHFTGVPLIRS